MCERELQNTALRQLCIGYPSDAAYKNKHKGKFCNLGMICAWELKRFLLLLLIVIFIIAINKFE